MDIEMYNFTHNVFADYRSGKFKQERAKSQYYERSNQMFEKVLKEKIDYVFMPLPHQIDSDLTMRCNSDVMNNYFIEIAARSFTDIEEVLYNKFENPEALKQMATIEETKSLQPFWTKEVGDLIRSVFKKMEKKVEEANKIVGDTSKFRSIMEQTRTQL
mmetsp:Transcript_20870/g.32211  ORF Transcript_20870/g.32211 Transcript_20870/m.32211 type:complete len:159 (+) Transcript_20870:175-651(+)